MAIKEQLRSDLTEAIRSRDELTSGTIRMLLSAITNEEVSGKTARELSDAEVITVLSREVKKRREAAEAFDLGGRPEKATLERAEGEVITKYLPTQLSAEELQTLITEAIAETGASGPAGMGLVMKVLAPKIAGKADGGTVSAAVKAALAN
ncbi:MAG: GatB/YqeY domain-containing protein [Actinomycetota bacterium]